MEKKFYQKGYWWAAVIAFIVPLINEFLGMNLSVGTVATAVAPLLAIIIGEEIKESKLLDVLKDKK